ncbi:MAG: threonine aldolase family protein [Sandaracinaceae bacterium]
MEMETGRRLFASDNAAGVLPEVMEALARANRGHAIGYGDDPITARATRAVAAAFGEPEVLFCWGGTGANVIGLRTICDSYQAVLCAEAAHIYVDECGAPERFLGAKLIPVPAAHGKIRPQAVEARIRGRGVVHHVQPRVLSISQPTEVGTVYTPGELRALAELCRRHDLLFHMDGARLYHAAACLDVELRATTTDVGVDVLSLGGTKAGLLGAEAVLFLRPELAERSGYFRKQAMQLASKMRFVAVQMEVLVGDGLWRRVARHANRLASLLAGALGPLPGVEVVHPVQTNAVFARLPRRVLPGLQEKWGFYEWEADPSTPVVRWMTSFDTTAEDVDTFVADLRAALEPGRGEPG